MNKEAKKCPVLFSPASRKYLKNRLTFAKIINLMAGIYLHIPFCKRRCIYCDFFSTTQSNLMPQYIDALCRELEIRKDYLEGEQIETIYWGGGTPSQLNEELLEQVFHTIDANYQVSDEAEVTLEANPDDLTPDYLARLARTGVNRLSIGVQSFDDGELRMMNRRHTAATARSAVRRAQEAGFDNIAVDLIFGVPGFGSDTLRRSLQELLDLGIQHISAYHLTIEPQTTFGRRAARGSLSPVDEQTSETEYLLIHRTLTNAGFDHYEISNYARPQRYALHNSAYWEGDPYLGIGPAAHSFDGEQRRWAIADIGRYLDGTERYGSERLTARDRYNETVMTSLRRAEGIDLGAVAERFGNRRRTELLQAAEPWIEAGDLAQQGERLYIPPERFLLSDAVIAALFWEC